MRNGIDVRAKFHAWMAEQPRTVGEVEVWADIHLALGLLDHDSARAFEMLGEAMLGEGE